MQDEIILALATVKSVYVSVNCDLGLQLEDKAFAIITAVDEIQIAQHAPDFSMSVCQIGSDTQSNRNMNEVFANHATEVHCGERY